MRGAVEVRSAILKRVVKPRDMKAPAPVTSVANLITSNPLRGE